ncbi:MAG: hypothetical protein KDC53_18950 [Saprospiraceae bacterium]|nr:hypothetical protein [Saprospiraceae bacterium]
MYRFVQLLFFIGAMALGSQIMAQELSNEEREAEKEQARLQRQKNKEYIKIAWKQPYPNPYKAALSSMILPGVGQIYNKRYWKAPIVWGGFYGLVVAVKFNKDYRQRFETAYELQLADKPHEFTGIINDSETLRRYRNKYDKQLQTTYVGFVALYALNVIDAYVDAHLKNFDIGDDLGFSISPVSSSGIGLGIRLNTKY